MRTFYVTARGQPTVFHAPFVLGEASKYAIDWTNYLGYRSSATISSSTWSSEDTSVVSAASATNSAGVTGATFTAGAIGETTLENSVTLSNGETLVRKLFACVTDPIAAEASDYPD